MCDILYPIHTARVSGNPLVDLLLKFRDYNGDLQLRDIMASDSVVLSEDIWEDLDEFRIYYYTLFCR